jgi:hypothetical protein
MSNSYDFLVQEEQDWLSYSHTWQYLQAYVDTAKIEFKLAVDIGP